MKANNFNNVDTAIFEHEPTHSILDIGLSAIRKRYQITRNGKDFYCNKITDFEGVTNIYVYDKKFDTFEHIAHNESEFKKYIIDFNKKQFEL